MSDSSSEEGRSDHALATQDVGKMAKGLATGRSANGAANGVKGKKAQKSRLEKDVPRLLTVPQQELRVTLASLGFVHADLRAALDAATEKLTAAEWFELLRHCGALW